MDDWEHGDASSERDNEPMWMRKRGILIAFCLAAGLFTAAFLAYRWETRPTILSFEPLNLRQVIEHPDSIHVFRIQSWRVTKTKEGQEKEVFLNPPVRLSNRRSLSPDEQANLISLLHAPGLQTEKKACVPHPGIEFVFTRAGKSIALDLCFSCAEAKFRDASKNSSADFSHVRSELVRLVKALFPEVAGVQPLLEEHSTELEGRPGMPPR
jgi:hypothetical protein